jgi:hypothetical protein
LGQALRGHMIRHKAITNEESRVYLDVEFLIYFFNIKMGNVLM